MDEFMLLLFDQRISCKAGKQHIAVFILAKLGPVTLEWKKAETKNFFFF